MTPRDHTQSFWDGASIYCLGSNERPHKRFVVTRISSSAWSESTGYAYQYTNEGSYLLTPNVAAKAVGLRTRASWSSYRLRCRLCPLDKPVQSDRWASLIAWLHENGEHQLAVTDIDRLV